MSECVNCARLFRAGFSPQEIALQEGKPLREVLRLLRLAGFVPHPLGRAIGLGATVAEEGLRISEGAFGRDVQGAIAGLQREVASLQQLPATIQNLAREIGKIGARLKGLP
jgi:hypothetical protein